MGGVIAIIAFFISASAGLTYLIGVKKISIGLGLLLLLAIPFRPVETSNGGMGEAIGMMIFLRIATVALVSILVGIAVGGLVRVWHISKGTWAGE
jgi:hypothetical protein